MVVQSVPAGLPGAAVGPALDELGASLQQADGSTPTERRERALTTIACHSAVQAGQVLSRSEMADILRHLGHCTSPRICAHGRPTLVVISGAQVAELVGRG